MENQRLSAAPRSKSGNSVTQRKAWRAGGGRSEGRGGSGRGAAGGAVGGDLLVGARELEPQRAEGGGGGGGRAGGEQRHAARPDAELLDEQGELAGGERVLHLEPGLAGVALEREHAGGAVAAR